MMDAFHYVDSRYLLAKESNVLSVMKVASWFCMYITAWLWIHRQANPFHLSEYRIVPQSPDCRSWEGTFRGFPLSDRLDLTKKSDAKVLEKTDAFCVAANMAMSSFEQVWEYILNTHEKLVINPLYEMHPNGNRVVLSRRFPSIALEMNILSLKLICRFSGDK